MRLAPVEQATWKSFVSAADDAFSVLMRVFLTSWQHLTDASTSEKQVGSPTHWILLNADWKHTLCLYSQLQLTTSAAPATARASDSICRSTTVRVTNLLYLLYCTEKQERVIFNEKSRRRYEISMTNAQIISTLCFVFPLPRLHLIHNHSVAFTIIPFCTWQSTLVKMGIKLGDRTLPLPHFLLLSLGFPYPFFPSLPFYHAKTLLFPAPSKMLRNVGTCFSSSTPKICGPSSPRQFISPSYVILSFQSHLFTSSFQT